MKPQRREDRKSSRQELNMTPSGGELAHNLLIIQAMGKPYVREAGVFGKLRPGNRKFRRYEMI